MAYIKERHITIKDLQKAGYPIVSGREYLKGLRWHLPKNRKVSLKEARKILSKIPTSFADEVIRARNEDRL